MSALSPGGVISPSPADARLFPAIFEHAPEGILLLDDSRRCVEANPAALRLLGYSHEELLQRTVEELTVPDDRPQIRSRWQTFLDQRTCQGLWRALTAAGQTLHAETRCQAHILPGIHLCLFRDIPPPQPDEAEVHLLRQALDALSTGIIITDQRQTHEPIVYVNRAVILLTGYSREELLGQNCRIFSGRYRDQPGLEEVRAAIRNGQSALVELVQQRKDDTLWFNLLSLTPLRDTHGVLTHYVRVLLDITHVRQRLGRWQPEVIATAEPECTSPLPAQEPQEPRPPEPPAAEPSSPHILVVEDEEAVREFIRLVLVQSGFIVTLAGDGEEAWEMFRRDPNRFDLVLSDVLMPRRNGPELAALIHSLRPTLPILFVSGYTGAASEKLQQVASQQLLVEKPFSIDKLLQAVRQALTRTAAPTNLPTTDA
jgi:PAS domain S-box-containing protein